MFRSKYRNINLIILLIIYESIMYLLCKLSPFSVHVLGSTLDSKIPFIPEFIYFYVSWYLMLFIFPYVFLKKNQESFCKYVTSTFWCITITTIIYLFFPTTILRTDMEITSFSTLLVKIIYLIDTPVLNCFPSMHCIICFLFIYIVYFDDKFSKKNKWIAYVWSLLVILSTLFIKQHVILDIISAFIISIVTYNVVCRTNCWKKIVLKEN